MVESILESPKDVLDLSCTLQKGEKKIIDLSNIHRTKDLKIIGNITLNKGSYLELVEVDLGRFNMDFHVTVTLSDNAEFYAHVAALNENKELKKYIVDVIHIGKLSKSKTSMFGVCSGESHMEFLGKSDIKKGAVKTNTRQEGKIINLSGKAKCIVSPALLIAEEDVFASHGATMGSVPEDDIFYLMSRGLCRKVAERLVMVGYLKPIILMLKDEKIKAEAIALLDSEL